MKLLFILPHPLVPANRGNKQHTLNILRVLGRQHQCDVIGFNERGIDEAKTWEELTTIVPNLRVVEAVDQIFGFELLIERIKCALTMRPIALARYRNPRLREIIVGLDLKSYDVVVLDMYTMVEMRALCCERPCVLIPSDAYSLAAFRVMRDSTTLQAKVRLFLSGLVHMRLECTAYPKFDSVVTVSKGAASWLRRIAPEGRYGFVPVAAEEALLSEKGVASSGQNPPVLLCWEGVSHDAVAARVAGFIKNAWPGIRRAVPNAELIVWGASPKPYLERLMLRSPGVKQLGYVKNREEVLRNADVFVFPSRSTGGMHVKLLSAFSVGLPVVGSDQSFEWFEQQQGINAYSARTWDDFREKCTILLKDPQKRAQMGQNARAMILANFKAEDVGKLMKEALDDAITHHGSSRAN